jgi:uncharacterized metal-binding protein YceD (DUF177 family)
MPDSAAFPSAKASPLGWGHECSEIHAGGLEQTRTASEDERVALASALGILACEQMRVAYRVTRAADEGYRLKGRLTADVVQACVITLAPVHETMAVDIKVEFRPAEELAKADGGAVDLEDETEYEPIEGTWLDIGRVVFEEMAANLNPYPRRRGAEFVPPAEPDAGKEDRANPFAVLEKLKKPPSPEQG